MESVLYGPYSMVMLLYCHVLRTFDTMSHNVWQDSIDLICTCQVWPCEPNTAHTLEHRPTRQCLEDTVTLIRQMASAYCGQDDRAVSVGNRISHHLKSFLYLSDRWRWLPVCMCDPMIIGDDAVCVSIVIGKFFGANDTDEKMQWFLFDLATSMCRTH